ncbi:MAG: archaellin/type IV pilin N-terminal domain-containing protein [Nitrososphaerota archaeon]
MFRLKRKTSAVSPVIATVIIVAIAITVAVGVGFWVMGITSSFTRFEKLEISSAYVDSSCQDATPITVGVLGTPLRILAGGEANLAVSLGNNYNACLRVRNTGTTDLSIDSVFLNGRPTDLENVIPGMTVEINLHTASGKDYPKTVVIP